MRNRRKRAPLTVPEGARKLKTSDQVVRWALIRGELDGFKIGRSWRIYPESIDRLIASGRSREEPTPDEAA